MTDKKARANGTVRSGLGCLVLLGCAIGLVHCGGNGGGPDPPTSSSVRDVVLEARFTGLQPLDVANQTWFQAFMTGTTGDLDITVDWTNAANDVDAALWRGTPEQLDLPACVDATPECPIELVVLSATLEKPETMSIRDVAAGNYLVEVANLGTTPEAGIIVIGLTTRTGSATPPALCFGAAFGSPRPGFGHR